MFRAAGRAVWLPVALCLFLTAAASALVHRAERTAEEAQFANDVISARARIHERMESYMAVLRAGAGLLSRPSPVTSPEFRVFVERLKLEDQYPGTQGIGYTARFGAVDAAAATAEARRLGWTNVSIWPETPRDEIHAIVLIEPLDVRNRAALGYDMHTEAKRRDAMDRARDTGDVTLSGKVTLVQEIEARKQPGVLMYSPVYSGGSVPRSPDERRAKLKGYVYAPLRAGDLLHGIFGDEKPRVVFDLYDGDEPAEDGWLYTSVPGIRPTDDVTVVRMPVAGQVWTARFARAPVPAGTLSLTLVVAVLGTLLSAIVLLVTRARERARAREVRATASALASQELLRLKEMFIGILGHDLRSPLNAIALGSDFLLRKHKDDAETVEMLRGVRSSVSRMTRMIEQILDLTRARLGGGIPIVEKSMELGPVVREVVEEIVLGTPEASIEVEAVGDLRGSWDGDRLAQVFSNLIGNAVRFRSGAPVRITVDGTAPDRVVAAVHNAGVIPPSLLPVVFEPFRRSPTEASTSSSGLGLGLYITQSIVGAHGGTISVTSTEGAGTTFTVVLPRDGAREMGVAPARTVTA